MLKSSIPSEIAGLHLPDSNGVVVIGGAVLELYNLRKADDIDMVVSLENWQYLGARPGWTRHTNKANGVYLTDQTARFDVWPQWYDLSLSELLQNSHQTEAGFYMPTIAYQIALKRLTGREKDKRDIALLKTLL